MQLLLYAQKWLGQKWQVAQPCSGQSRSDRSPTSPTSITQSRTTRCQGRCKPTPDTMEWSLKLPSVLWHCWFGGREGVRPVKHWLLVCCWFNWSWVQIICTCFIVLVVTTASSSSRAAVSIECFILLPPAYAGCRERCSLSECIE